MKVTINLKYAGDGSVNYLKDVPSDCTILQLKAIVAKMNKMETTDSIRLVQRGKILENDQQIGSLYLKNNNEMTIYAAGIPGKVHKKAEPIETRQGVRPTTPIPNNTRLFIRKANEFLEEHKKGILMIIIIMSLTLLLAIFSVSTISADMPKRQVPGFFNDIKALFHGEFRFRAILKLLLLIMPIILMHRIVKKAGAQVVINCTLLFFKSLMPTFDVNDFRASHNVL